jgi:hypothetical protein
MKLTHEEQLTEAARKTGGEDNALVEMAFAHLRERGADPNLECRICSFQWDRPICRIR